MKSVNLINLLMIIGGGYAIYTAFQRISEVNGKVDFLNRQANFPKLVSSNTKKKKKAS